LRGNANFTETENGCLTNRSTLSEVLDFFALGGALRQRTESDIVRLFASSFGEDALLATRTAFYLRDVRGGQGERRTFRTILKYLANAHPDIVRKNLENIPFFGRWDDIFALVGTKCEKDAFELVRNQLASDVESDHPSLLAKWIKSNKNKTWLAIYRKTREYLGMNSETFRKTIVALRKKIKIVETRMCANEWGEIEYDALPSRASLVHAKAFKKHDGDRYDAFIDCVKNGVKKINASTLYPYDIVRSIFKARFDEPDDESLNVLWDALPDYTRGENALVLADTSGSMQTNAKSLPLYVSVSLAIYFAERNAGPFQGYFMGFSRTPTFYKIRGTTIHEKVMSVKRATSACENTDLIACFKLILDTAIQSGVGQEDMPTKLYIISDMEFDRAYPGNKKTAYGTIDEMFASSGYARPALVFWNVNARRDQVPVTKDEHGTFLVSGASPSIFKNAMETRVATPIDLMLDVLNSERYQRVVV
jgi:hypothetical protein